MTVVKLWANGKVLDSEVTSAEQITDKTLLAETILFNCSAVIDQNGTPKGNCTEVGIITYMLKLGIDAQRMLQAKEDNIETKIPFNSKRKRATIAIAHPDDINKVRVFVKGAPEIVINNCDKYIDESGEAAALDEEKKKDIIDNVVVEQFAKKALRTILVAYCDYTREEFDAMRGDNNNFATENDREVMEKDLTAVAIFALEDPLRDEIKGAIEKCKIAGITVRMVTGDNINTAKAIAVKAGIISEAELDEEYVCMEGKDFNEKCGGLQVLEEKDNRGKSKESIGNKA